MQLTAVPVRGRLALVGLLAAALLGGGLAGPAGAVTVPGDPSVWSQADRRHDVWAQDLGQETPVPETSEDVGDVRRLRVRHRPHRVVVYLRFERLRRDSESATYRAALQRGDARRFELRLDTARGRWQGRVRLFRGNTLVPCRVRHSIRYDLGRARMALSRACLGRPARLRAHLDAYRVDAEGIYHVDDAMSPAARSDAWTPWIPRQTQAAHEAELAAG